MAKQTTEQKLETLGKFAVKHFENGLVDIEEIAGLCFLDGATKETGLKLAELTPLVRTWGIQEGYIKPLEARREECIQEVKEWPEHVTWAEFCTLTENLAEKHSLPEKWVIDNSSQVRRNLELNVPEKFKILPWQVAAILAAQKDPEKFDREICKVAIAPHVQNADSYVNYCYPVIKALLTSIDVAEYAKQD